ncbi:MAG: MFS transporter [Alphaproteobacteria bacterium]|nr:MAG: MFS transporter [Alphaproteobacteria bacterium]
MGQTASDAGVHHRPSQHLALGFSALGHVFTHLLMMLYLTLVLVLEREWQMSYASLIGLVFWSQVLYGVAALPAGWLGDRWSAPGMMVVFFIGTGAATIAAGLARTPVELTLALAAIGVFSAIYHPVGIAWLVRVAENRGKAIGINGVFGSIGIGGAALVAGGLADVWSWRAAFIVPGAVCVAVGLVLWVCIWTGAVRDQAADRTPDPPSSAGDRLRAFWVLSVTMFVMGVATTTASLVLPKLFDSRIAEVQGSTTVVGALVSLIYVCTAMAQVLGGYLADRMPLRRAYCLTMMIQVPLVLAVAHVTGLPLVLVTAVAMVSQSAALPAENLLLARYTPPAWRATAFGAKFVLALGAAALAVPAVQIVYEGWGGVAPVFTGLAALTLLGALAALLLPREQDRAPVEAPALKPAE